MSNSMQTLYIPVLVSKYEYIKISIYKEYILRTKLVRGNRNAPFISREI